MVYNFVFAMLIVVLCFYFAFTSWKLFDNKSYAGTYGTTGFYDNAPAILINQGNSLFKSNGDINTSTLLDLLNKVNDENVVNDENGNKVEAVNGVTYLTAKNFGQYGDQSSYTEAQKGNAQIILKLFEDSTNTENGVDSFTEQYWQAVFRSTDDEKDVLTLYMCFPFQRLLIV